MVIKLLIKINQFQNFLFIITKRLFLMTLNDQWEMVNIKNNDKTAFEFDF